MAQGPSRARAARTDRITEARKPKRRAPSQGRQEYALALGKAVELARERAGMTRAELARAIGVSAPTMTRIESGQTVPNAMVLAEIARELGLSHDKLHAVITKALELSETTLPSFLKGIPGAARVAASATVAGLVVGAAVASIWAGSDSEE